MYRLEGGVDAQVRLLGSGTLVREAQAAAQLLAEDWQVASEVFSVTSFSELAREARDVERWNRLHPQAAKRCSHVQDCLPHGAPVIAVSDYVRAVPQMIASYLDASYTVLGTDGFGRSDTRAALRDFFEVDRHHIVLAALTALVKQGSLEARVCQEAIARYGLQTERDASWVG
jgi:pyruvate dehydrogenase E1 component